MTMIEERTARLEAERENEQEWRREMLARFGRLEARLDRVEANQRWIVGLLIAILIAVIGGMAWRHRQCLYLREDKNPICPVNPVRFS